MATCGFVGTKLFTSFVTFLCVCLCECVCVRVFAVVMSLCGCVGE